MLDLVQQSEAAVHRQIDVAGRATLTTHPEAMAEAGEEVVRSADDMC